MIRLTWRQFRAEAIVAVAALVAVAAIVLVTGLHLSHLFDVVMTRCRAKGDCKYAAYSVTSAYGRWGEGLGALILALPALIGIFWGAPMAARELETGSYRLTWTQSVTRRRWLGVKLAALGLASIVTAGLFTLMVTWWAGPLNITGAGRFVPGNFGEQGIVPVGYAAFAFALGVALGLLLRRTLVAMAATLAVFAGIVFAIKWLRPDFMSPVRRTFKLTGNNLQPFPTSTGLSFRVIPPATGANSWIYTAAAVDSSGHPITSQYTRQACPANMFRPGKEISLHQRSGRPSGGPPFGQGSGNHQVPGGPPGPGGSQGPFSGGCVNKVLAHFHGLVSYQPAGRYWAFQAIETAIFLALALGLAWFCFVWIRRRLA
jgi:hypothetical protein